MTATVINDGPQSKWFRVHVTGNATAVANSLGSIANPEGVALHINAGYLKVIAPPAGAADLDIGIGATGADSTDLASDLQIDGYAADEIYYVVSNNSASQDAATSPQGLAWPATSYLNFYNNAAAESAAFEAYLYLQYIRVGNDESRA
jgi:hypothetical protein